MPSTRQKWTANSMIGPLTLVVTLHPALNRSPMRLPQLARAVVSPRVSLPVLSTLSRQSSRRSERRSAKRTISAYPVCKNPAFIYCIPFVLVLIQNNPPLLRFSEKTSFFNYLAHTGTAFSNSNFSQHRPTRWVAWAVPRSRADHSRLSSDVGHLLRRV
jgi:hypothetical protein